MARKNYTSAAAMMADIERTIKNPALVRRILRMCGKALRDDMRKRLNQSGPGWAPLKPSTIADRKRRGIQGTKPLLATRLLYDNIDYKVSGHKVEAGVFSNQTYAIQESKRAYRARKGRGRPRVSHTTVTEVARIHEYGSGHTPPRPFVRPALANTRHIIKEIFLTQLKGAFGQAPTAARVEGEALAEIG